MASLLLISSCHNPCWCTKSFNELDIDPYIMFVLGNLSGNLVFMIMNMILITVVTNSIVLSQCSRQQKTYLNRNGFEWGVQ